MAKKKKQVVVAPKKVVEQFEVKDTGDLQIQSLIEFMSQLGYAPARQNGGWVNNNPILKANKNLSNATAIFLHNSKKKAWERIGETPFFRCPAQNVDLALSFIQLQRAYASRYVEKVKLQATRKGTGFQLQYHMVKPADKRLAEIMQLA